MPDQSFNGCILTGNEVISPYGYYGTFFSNPFCFPGKLFPVEPVICCSHSDKVKAIVGKRCMLCRTNLVADIALLCCFTKLVGAYIGCFHPGKIRGQCYSCLSIT